MPSPAASVSTAPSSPFDQGRYQVRFDWGVEGLGRLAASDVVVLVDVLGFSSASVGSASPAVADALAAASEDAVVLLAGLRNPAAVADAVLAEQQRRGRRTSIAVIACGGRERFAVEGLLGAGGVVDALGARGIDHTSPEAAAACGAFSGLRGALRHLLTASGSGQELVTAGRRAEALAAAELDADAIAPVLRAGSTRASTSHR